MSLRPLTSPVAGSSNVTVNDDEFGSTVPLPSHQQFARGKTPNMISPRAARRMAGQRNREKIADDARKQLDRPLSRLKSIGIEYDVSPVPPARSNYHPPFTAPYGSMHSMNSSRAGTAGSSSRSGTSMASRATYPAFATATAHIVEHFPSRPKTQEQKETQYAFPLVQVEDFDVTSETMRPIQPIQPSSINMAHKLRVLHGQLDSQLATLPGGGAGFTHAHSSAAAIAAHHRAVHAGLHSLRALGQLMGNEGPSLTSKLEELFTTAIFNCASSTLSASNFSSTPSQSTYRQECVALAQRAQKAEHMVQTLMQDAEGMKKQLQRLSAASSSAAPSAPISTALVTQQKDVGKPMISLERFYKQLDLLSKNMMGTDALEQQINDLKQDLYRADVQAHHMNKENQDLQRQLELLNSNLIERDRLHEIEVLSHSTNAILAASPHATAAGSSSSDHTAHTSISSASVAAPVFRPSRGFVLEESEEFVALWTKYQSALEQVESLSSQLKTAQRVSDSYRWRAARASSKEKEEEALRTSLQQRVKDLEHELATRLRPLTPRPDWSKFPVLMQNSTPWQQKKAREFESMLLGGVQDIGPGLAWEEEDATTAPGLPLHDLTQGARSGRTSPSKPQWSTRTSGRSTRAPSQAGHRGDSPSHPSRPLSPAHAPIGTGSLLNSMPPSLALASATMQDDTNATGADADALLNVNHSSMAASAEEAKTAHQRMPSNLRVSVPAEAEESKFGEVTALASQSTSPTLTNTDTLIPTALNDVTDVNTKVAFVSGPTHLMHQYSTSPPLTAAEHSQPSTATIIPPPQAVHSFFPKPPENAGVRFIEVAKEGDEKSDVQAFHARHHHHARTMTQPLYDVNGLLIPGTLDQRTESKLFTLYLSYKDAVSSKEHLQERVKKVIRALQAELRDTRDKLAIAEAYVSDTALASIHSSATAATTVVASATTGVLDPALLEASLSNTPAAPDPREDPLRSRHHVKYFIGLGTDMDVPIYLRAHGKIRNKNFSKRECETLVKQVLQARTEYTSDLKNKPMTMAEFFYHFLKKRFGVKSLVIEWSYGMIDALERYRWDADCELFLKLLRGQIHEAAWHDQLSMIEKLLSLCQKLDISLHGKLSGKVPKTLLLYTLKNLFPLKPNTELHEISKCLNADQPGPVVAYNKLFEESKDGDQGLFAEKIRDGHLAELESFMVELQDRSVRDLDEQGTCALADIRAAWTHLDPHRPRDEITASIALAIDHPTGPDNPSIKWTTRVPPVAFFRSLFGKCVVKKAKNFDPTAKPHVTVSTGLKRAYSVQSSGSASASGSNSQHNSVPSTPHGSTSAPSNFPNESGRTGSTTFDGTSDVSMVGLDRRSSGVHRSPRPPAVREVASEEDRSHSFSRRSSITRQSTINHTHGMDQDAHASFSKSKRPSMRRSQTFNK